MVSYIPKMDHIVSNTWQRVLIKKMKPSTWVVQKWESKIRLILMAISMGKMMINQKDVVFQTKGLHY